MGKPVLTLAPKPGTDVTTVILDTTEAPTDTDMDTVTWENAPLMPNPPLLLNLKLMLNLKLRLKLPQKPKLNPGTDITVMVDTTDIPTDTTDIPVLTMVVTGGNFLPFPKVLPFFNPLVSFL